MKVIQTLITITLIAYWQEINTASAPKARPGKITASAAPQSNPLPQAVTGVEQASSNAITVLQKQQRKIQEAITLATNARGEIEPAIQLGTTVGEIPD